MENGARRRIEDRGGTAFGDELRERCGSGGFSRELAIKELEHVVEAFGCGGGGWRGTIAVKEARCVVVVVI